MSTLLAKGIKFKLMINQLSKDEFLTFMSKIYDINHSHLIATSLFNYFIHPSSITNPNTNDLNDINLLLSEIIQSRKSKPKQETTHTTPIKLDAVPKALTGHIASFLKQNEYFQFQQTNRSIFIGCNCPNTLITLDLLKIPNYSSINLQQFKSLKKLMINLNTFNQFKLPQNGEYVINELEYLELDANDGDIEPFMNQNCINIENVKRVRFSHFGHVDISRRFNTNKFCKILFKFKNIESLSLFGVLLSDDIPTQKLQQLYDLHPTIEGLEVNGGLPSANNGLTNKFGNKLRFLIHSNNPSRNFDFGNINFIHLEQVILVTPAVTTVNGILKSAKNIRKFCMYSDAAFNSNSPSPEELKTIIPQIFKCKLLKYFQIEINTQNYLHILDGIEKGVFETKTMKRKQIKIKVELNNRSQIDIKSIIINIGRIIRWLEASNINDFMFIYDLKMFDKTQIKSLDSKYILKEFDQISSNIQAQYDETGFVITNKNCNICGWTESWAMPFLL